MGSRDLLFYGNDLDLFLHTRRVSIVSTVDSIPRDQFLNANPEAVIEHLASSLEVDPLVLYEDRAHMEHQETKIDISQWQDRNPFCDAGPLYVVGIQVVVTIPYSGESSLWHLKPQRWRTTFLIFSLVTIVRDVG